MENTLTQQELKEALLEALLDYDSIKKTRRMRAVKKTLQGTMVATLIGSTGLMASNQGRNNHIKESAAITAISTHSIPVLTDFPPETSQSKFIPGVAHFGFNKHTLTPGQEERLFNLVSQLPKDSEITVIGRTDSIGSKKYNEKLGRLRAQAVADFLALRGLKIKAIGSKISNNLSENWLKRRVDIVVDSPSTTPIFLKSAAPENPQVNKQPQSIPKPQMPSNTNAFSFRSAIPLETNRSPAATNLEQTLPENFTTVINKKKPEQAPINRQKVRGTAHFPLNSDELTWTNKQRLMELIKQLPKDAVLTVVGRTELEGAEDNGTELGMQRAKAVAEFLSNFGVKVNAVASKESSYGFTGWGARRVDIIIDSTAKAMPVNLPEPLQEYSYKRGNSKTENPPIAIERDTSPKRNIPNPYIYNVE
jgi:outer membrane protein OmpA-like peptidoglycan-associated protein